MFLFVGLFLGHGRCGYGNLDISAHMKKTHTHTCIYVYTHASTYAVFMYTQRHLILHALKPSQLP